MRDQRGLLGRLEWRLQTIGKTVTVKLRKPGKEEGADDPFGGALAYSTPEEARQLDRYADALKEGARFLDPDLGPTEADTRDALAKVLEALEDGVFFVTRGPERSKALAALEALRGLGLTVPEPPSGATAYDFDHWED